MALAREREQLYSDLEERAGNTPLTELTQIPVPNGNRIFLKDESSTVAGTKWPLNHYGRVFVRLYKALEEDGKLKPGDMAFDSSQGNAALALTAIGHELGFLPYAIVPGGNHVSENMLKYLNEAGANLVWTKGEDYVNDFRPEILRFLREHPSAVFLNHSRGRNERENNETTLAALEEIASEVLHDIRPDYFIGVWGNGSSLFGPARKFKQAGAECIGWELLSQAVAYEYAYPGKFESEFGIPLQALSHIHGIPGSSYRGKGRMIVFPHIANAVTGKEPTVAENRLAVYDEIIEGYNALVSDKALQDKAASLPDIGKTMDMLDGIGMKLGRTSAGNIAAALALASEPNVKGKTITTLIYDRRDKYDTPMPV